MKKPAHKNCLIKRAYLNRPLTKEDKAFNQIQSRIRSTVERVFGVLKLHYAMGKARYLGLGEIAHALKLCA